jgi:hypothetical protein
LCPPRRLRTGGALGHLRFVRAKARRELRPMSPGRFTCATSWPRIPPPSEVLAAHQDPPAAWRGRALRPTQDVRCQENRGTHHPCHQGARPVPARTASGADPAPRARQGSAGFGRGSASVAWSAGVAQLEAQATCNRQVVGSSPTTGSEKASSSPTLLKSRIGRRSCVPHLYHILRAVPRHDQPKARSASSFGPCSACGRWSLPAFGSAGVLATHLSRNSRRCLPQSRQQAQPPSRSPSGRHSSPGCGSWTKSRPSWSSSSTIA